MKYVIANFKSHKNSQEITSWFDGSSSLPAVVPDNQSIKTIIALPFPYLHLIKSLNYNLAAQDVSPFPPGSYTGAVNALQLKDLGVSYCIVGHSERRKYFHETSAEVTNKVHELLTASITPIVCVSQEDIPTQLASLDHPSIANSIFAYETLSDIGKDQTSPIDEIIQAVNLIKKYTNDEQQGILYGGSVAPENVDTVINLVDGVLVATASLKPESFHQIINKVNSHV